MGIYIKCLGMPSSCNGCWNCDINNMDGSEAKEPYFCLIKMKFVEEDFETCRPKWCPLIEVPDGHGRLIDVDALELDISQSVVFSGRSGNPEICGANKVMDRIHRADTVIP